MGDFDEARLESVMKKKSFAALRPRRVVAAANLALAVPIALTLVLPVEAVLRAYEFDSVKENTSGRRDAQIRIANGTFTATNLSLFALIVMAYELPAHHVVDAPVWTKNERFDIVAARDGPWLSEGPTTMADTLRSLLTRRFKLIAHPVRKTVPLYSLVLARADRRLGPHLKAVAVDCSAAFGASSEYAARSGARSRCGLSIRNGSISSGAASMPQLVRSLSTQLNRVVRDDTGLAGLYEFHLTFPSDGLRGRSPRGLSADGTEVHPHSAALMSALRQQLGLTLEPTTGPADALVIDSVERPTGN